LSRGNFAAQAIHVIFGAFHIAPKLCYNNGAGQPVGLPLLFCAIPVKSQAHNRQVGARRDLLRQTVGGKSTAGLKQWIA